MSKKIFIFLFLTFICLANYNDLLADNYKVSEIYGNIKISSDPSELIDLHREGQINPRALMAFGKLPDEFVSLAMKLRSYDIDLLRADIHQIEEYIDQARSGIIDIDPEILINLKFYILDKKYINWSNLKTGDIISGYELLWFDDNTWMMLQSPEGGESRISSSGVLQLETDNLAFVIPEEDKVITDDFKTVITDLKIPEAAGEDLSPRAASLYEYWVDIFETQGFFLKTVDGFLVEETSDKIVLQARLADYTLESDVEVNNVLKFYYKPINDEIMDFEVQLPERIWLHDEQAMPVGLSTFSDHNINGKWSNQLESPIKLDAMLTNINFFPDALASENDSQEMISVDNISLRYNMEKLSQSAWDIQGKLQASNLYLFEHDGSKVLHCASLTQSIAVEDHQTGTLSALIPAVIHMVEHEEKDLFLNVFEDVVMDYGDLNYSMVVEDLEIHDLEDIKYLKVGHFENTGQTSRSIDAPQSRDFIGGYKFRDLKVLADDADFFINGFSFETGLTGVDVVKLGMLMNLEKLMQENPFIIVDIFQEFLDGFHLAFSFSEFQGSHEDLDFSGLNDLSMRLSVSGLKELMPSIGINYNHSGLKSIEDVPYEVTPEDLQLGINIARIPVMDIINTTMTGQMSEAALLEVFTIHDSSFELDELDVKFPGANISLKGFASAGEKIIPDIGIVHLLMLNSTLEIENIDHLEEYFLNLMSSPDDKENLKAIVAFIKLVSEEHVQEDGTSLHHVTIISNEQGEITANGKDIKPLIDIIHN